MKLAALAEPAVIALIPEDHHVAPVFKYEIEVAAPHGGSCPPTFIHTPLVAHVDDRSAGDRGGNPFAITGHQHLTGQADLSNRCSYRHPGRIAG